MYGFVTSGPTAIRFGRPGRLGDQDPGVPPPERVGDAEPVGAGLLARPRPARATSANVGLRRWVMTPTVTRRPPRCGQIVCRTANVAAASSTPRSRSGVSSEKPTLSGRSAATMRRETRADLGGRAPEHDLVESFVGDEARGRARRRRPRAPPLPPRTSRRRAQPVAVDARAHPAGVKISRGRTASTSARVEHGGDVERDLDRSYRAGPADDGLVERDRGCRPGTRRRRPRTRSG